MKLPVLFRWPDSEHFDHQNSFSAFEKVIRSGGLLSAIDPEITSKRLNPESKEFILQCHGFNEKNCYERQTPCDHDTLRKALKDASAESWTDWHNTKVQKIYQRYGFFDPEGVMKLLILDRGFIDGERISYCKQELGVDVLSPVSELQERYAEAGNCEISWLA